MLLYFNRSFRDVLTVSPIFQPLGFARGHTGTQKTDRRSRSRNSPAVHERVYQISLTESVQFTAIFPPVGIAS